MESNPYLVAWRMLFLTLLINKHPDLEGEIQSLIPEFERSFNYEGE